MDKHDLLIKELKVEITEFNTIKDGDIPINTVIWNLLTSEKWRSRISALDFKIIFEKLTK